jgi:rhodanese-related sulfurtransferase
MLELPTITVAELAAKMAAEPTPLGLQLVDVREPQELAVAALCGFVNLPLSQSAAWTADIHTRLDAETETLVLCHHGMRSAQMCEWLLQQGFTQVKNITGGIDAYSTLVDPTVPRY